MKTFLLAGLLLSGLGACATLRPPTTAQIAAQQFPTRPAGIYDGQTVTHKSKPLVFIDGNRRSNFALRQLDPKRIDSVRAVNPSIGAGLYGHKGREGVVTITTKKKGQ